MTRNPQVLPGESFPLGATVYDHGVNFSVFSQNASAIELLLFNQAQADQPTYVIKLDPRRNRTYHYWHVFIPNLKAGQIYAYRAYGEFTQKKRATLRQNQGAARSLCQSNCRRRIL